MTTNLSVFSIDWTDLQLNKPNPQVPGQFFISNVGGARSSGVEAEVSGRARDGVDLFATFGYTHARFDEGTTSIDITGTAVPVGGNTIPNTPDYTASFGTQLSHPMSSAVRLYGRAEVVFYGAFKYDDLNQAGQDAIHGQLPRRARQPLFVEGWIRMRRHYVPSRSPIRRSWPRRVHRRAGGEPGLTAELAASAVTPTAL